MSGSRSPAFLKGSGSTLFVSDTRQTGGRRWATPPGRWSATRWLESTVATGGDGWRWLRWRRRRRRPKYEFRKFVDLFSGANFLYRTFPPSASSPALSVALISASYSPLSWSAIEQKRSPKKQVQGTKTWPETSSVSLPPTFRSLPPFCQKN